MTTCSWRLPLAAWCLALSVASAAMADDAPLEEVVVTAQLRERPLGAVAASVTVLDSQALQRAGVQHFQDVLGLVPNLNWSAGSSRPRYFQLRGIGELEQWQGAPNPSVGFLIDGVDFSGIGMPVALDSVERIEILRGPQAGLYGANALAGLIVVQSREATSEFTASAELRAGENNTIGMSSAVGGPLGAGPNDAWRVSAGHYRSDGFRRNSFVGRDDTNGYRESHLQSKLRLQPNNRLRLDLTTLWSELDNGYDAFSIDNTRTTQSDRPGRDTQLARAVSLRIAYDGAERFSVRSTTAWGVANSLYSFDGDWGNDLSWARLAPDYAPYDFAQSFARHRTIVSEDLRILSRSSVDAGARFAWLAGAYAARTGEEVTQRDTYRDAYLGEGGRLLVSDYAATNIALYGESEWALAASTSVAIGARLESRRTRYDDSDGTSSAPSESMIGGNVSLRHRWSPQQQLYATLARGYKAGGFNIGAAVPDERREFAAELLHSIEVGTRGAWLGGILKTELAAFYMRRSRQQVASSVQLVPGDPLTFVLYTTNAARGENAGLEASLVWQANARWQVDLRAGLLEARYLDYQFGERNLSGREQAHAPQYQYNLGVDYRATNGWFVRADVSGKDNFFFDTAHDERSAAYTLTNLKVGYERDIWRAEFWVRNLFDEYYSQRGFFFGTEPPDFTPKRYLQAGDPRQAGVTIAYSFK